MSSRGCEAQIKANTALIGKNVVATSIIQFTKYTPYEGGFDIVSVTCSDPAGSIPDVLKNRQATRNANAPINTANFILSGKLPSD